MAILIVVLAVLSFIASLCWWVSRNRPIDLRKFKKEIFIWCEVAYQRGYDDFKAGKPQEIWDVDALAKSAPKRILLNGLKQAYQKGYRDAFNNLPIEDRDASTYKRGRFPFIDFSSHQGLLFVLRYTTISQLGNRERKRRNHMARYMMATKAIHKLGDISRDEPDLCVIHGEDEENYIGNWVTGFCFIDVKFPKSTTRELTEEEKEFNNACAVIEDYCQTGGKNLRGGTGLNSKETEISTKAIVVATQNSVYRFGEANQKGERTVSRDRNSLDFTRCVIVSLNVGDDMELKCLDGSHPGWYTTRVLSIK